MIDRHMSPQPFSHYEILDKLGEGGMGVVWKARDTRLNRLVAIKTLPADKLADEGRRRRFIQEAQAASRPQRSQYRHHLRHRLGERH